MFTSFSFFILFNQNYHIWPWLNKDSTNLFILEKKMTETLLKSEISRLILCNFFVNNFEVFIIKLFLQNSIVYLEDQKWTDTYKVFLTECQNLKEMREFMSENKRTPRTVHNKTLEEYLVIEKFKTCNFIYQKFFFIKKFFQIFIQNLFRQRHKDTNRFKM